MSDTTMSTETVESTLPSNGFRVPDIYVEEGDKEEDPDRLFGRSTCSSTEKRGTETMENKLVRTSV